MIRRDLLQDVYLWFAQQIYGMESKRMHLGSQNNLTMVVTDTTLT